MPGIDTTTNKNGDNIAPFVNRPIVLSTWVGVNFFTCSDNLRDYRSCLMKREHEQNVKGQAFFAPLCGWDTSFAKNVYVASTEKNLVT